MFKSESEYLAHIDSEDARQAALNELYEEAERELLNNGCIEICGETFGIFRLLDEYEFNDVDAIDDALGCAMLGYPASESVRLELLAALAPALMAKVTQEYDAQEVDCDGD